MPIFYTDDPIRDFERWDAWHQQENERIKYEREQEEETDEE